MKRVMSSISTIFWKVWDWPLTEYDIKPTEVEKGLRPIAESCSLIVALLVVSAALTLPVSWIIVATIIGAVSGYYIGLSLWVLIKTPPRK